jgi:Fe-S-cluster containining protein
MQSCNCNECISACLNDPGRLVPEDLSRLSISLKISINDLEKKYLIRVPVTVNGHIVYALAPVKKKGRRFIAEPGTIAPDYYASEKGRCIFLDDNCHCAVHEAKPFECGAYMGCRNTFLGKPYRVRTVEEFFYKRWRSRQLDL